MGEGMMNLDLVRLGQDIRRRRIALGWTLDQFAEACGVTPNYLGTLENGRRDPHISTLVSIARALGCSLADLLAEPDGDVSPRGIEVGRLFDQASPQAQEAAAHVLRVLVKQGGGSAPQGKGAGKTPRRPREGEPPS
jgi:transcriptional regulator with XRE-family HTH domain